MKKSDIKVRDLPKDILTGVIIAFVSIPISMGYAQISGLPAVYGLYGSIFPILVFGLMSSSKQFIFGVDAAPAALVGASLVTMGIRPGGRDAMNLVPMITLCVSGWLFVFRFLRAGRLVNYISTPVMGGFISGISTTIIFMQIPKLLGGTSGTGELPELTMHLIQTFGNGINHMSLILGAVSLAVLLISKKFVPKLPISVVVMAAGAALGYSGFAEKYGVVRLSVINPGLPAWELPHPDLSLISEVLSASLTVATVIMAETLLASNSYANKNGYKLDNDREILTYAIGNTVAALTGCCPVNGSVSRTSMGEQYGGSSQVMSITASVTMMIIMLFCTGFIGYLPVPVLTAIVISALLGAVEFHLFRRLLKQDRRELLIFLAAFFGVLIFGTVYGVAIGAVLSFVSVIVSTANPKRSFLGVIPGHEGFHSLERNSFAVPVKGAVLYRFSGNLYFANISAFIDDIEKSISDDTRCVIVDSGAICSIDVTSADRISSLRKSLFEHGIGLYFASHIGALNDRFRELGLGMLVEQGHCRRTITAALSAAGITAPYELENNDMDANDVSVPGIADRLEFEWAFGADADEQLELYTNKIINAVENDNLSSAIRPDEEWADLGELDQEGLLVHLQAHLKELAERSGLNEDEVEKAIELRKIRLALRLEKIDPHVIEIIRNRTEKFEKQLKDKHPERYEELIKHRKTAIAHLRESSPEYAALIEKFYK